MGHEKVEISLCRSRGITQGPSIPSQERRLGTTHHWGSNRMVWTKVWPSSRSVMILPSRSLPSLLQPLNSDFLCSQRSAQAFCSNFNLWQMTFSTKEHEDSTRPTSGDHLGSPGLVSDSKGPYQDQLIVGQLSGPVGFGAIPLKKSLCAVNLVLVLPSGQTLQGRKTISDINYSLGSGVGRTQRTLENNCQAEKQHMVLVSGAQHPLR